jgi:hypothetical protein
MIAKFDTRNDCGLLAMLQTVLDCVDYTAGACRPNEPVGGVLPQTLISFARATIKESRESCTTVAWIAGAAKRRVESAVIRAIWQRGKEMLATGDGCQLCYGHYRPVAEQLPIGYRHEHACQWPALDAAMREMNG